MEQHDAKVLWDKYKAGEASKEEEQIILNWFHSFNKDELFDLNETELEQIHKAMLQNVSENISVLPVRKALWPRIAVAAAAAVAIIVSGLWFYNATSVESRHPEFISGSQNDVAPGKNGATITLANGKVIKLSDARSGVIVGGGKIAYSSLRAGEGARQPHQDSQNEIASIPRNEVMELTASTAKGQTYQFTLPDGTKVWLNADSKIEFPSSFVNSKTRNIKLSGEGYFEVYKDKAHLFVVESEGQRVEVLGTHFNISAYSDDNGIKTTLLEGSVRVNAASNKSAVTLRPNQQATVTANAGITVKQVDPEMTVAWKNNKFMFESQGIQEIMKMVARWYNVEIVYEGEMPTDKFGGSVSRFDNVSKVLRALEKTKNVRFHIEGKTIYVSK
ncbi:FecR family protein [Pedobacter ginsengisoli]|uniref:FecR family protein n=1 Tax=Pedobacter ginsengisoli TaxID=363852 RepID=UPI0025502A98|nr:FecR domain-containing protein [Pedobacter ginsengisoli]